MADEKAAGGIIYLREDGRVYFLLLRAAKHGEWGPPKGHAETGESEVETATREICEETGFRHLSFDPDFREALRYSVTNKKGVKADKEVVFFLAETDPETDELRLSIEHTEAHMGTLEEIEVMLVHEDLKDLFRKAHAHILKTRS
jgi:8-oxo-dGTP pyrophosphatase MutT (NUDIX family)